LILKNCRHPSPHIPTFTVALHGQVFVAQTSIAQDLRGTDRIKIVCARSASASAKIKPAGQ
jgi:hypothetical protein